MAGARRREAIVAAYQAARGAGALVALTAPLVLIHTTVSYDRGGDSCLTLGTQGAQLDVTGRGAAMVSK